MFRIFMRPMPNGALDRVYIARDGADLRLDLAGRRSAVAWLTGQGCCPGAAAMLHGADYGPVYEIAEPGDASHTPEVDVPLDRCASPARVPRPRGGVSAARRRELAIAPTDRRVVPAGKKPPQDLAGSPDGADRPPPPDGAPV